MAKRVKYVLYLDQIQITSLRRISKRTRIPASVIAREAIDMILKKYKKKD